MKPGVTWKTCRSRSTQTALDDAEPFTIFMAVPKTTMGGPSRTDNVMASVPRIGEWSSGDGHQPATEPGNSICSMRSGSKAMWRSIYQPANRSRKHGPMTSERFNWDSPILVGEHESKRLCFASRRVWRSDDRGDSWTAISDDP